MRVYLKRTLTGFVPDDEASTEAVRGYRLGEVYKADIVKPRNYQHHKLAFALLGLTYQNQDRYGNFEDFRKAVALAAGHSTELVGLDGEIVRLPASLSYDALDEIEFGKVMASMMTVCAHLLFDMNVDELADQVAVYASQRAA